MQNIIENIIQIIPNIFDPFVDHLILAGGAFLISILIAFPLAIFCIYNKKLTLIIINSAKINHKRLENFLKKRRTIDVSRNKIIST